MSAMKLAVMGAAGRMGRELVRAVQATGGGAVVAGAIERAGSNAIGQDAGELAGIGKIVCRKAAQMIHGLPGVPRLPVEFRQPWRGQIQVDLRGRAELSEQRADFLAEWNEFAHAHPPAIRAHIMEHATAFQQPSVFGCWN